MAKLRKKSFYIKLLIVLFVLVWVYRGLQWDPRITTNKLRGLTPNQVVAILGSPHVDPRRPEFGGWKNEDADGPLILYYDDRFGLLGQGYAVIFHNGRVAEVKRGEK